jgi:hypothetical protein
MAGGLMQLVAIGAQDAFLSGNPQITFFKVVYRRHTNFAIEAIEQTFNGTVDFGRKVSATISRNGDLIHKMYLQVQLPALSGGTQGWVDYVGHHMIKEVEIEVGGARIDRHYGQWMHIWSELTLTKAQEDNYKKMVGSVAALTGQATTRDAYTLYVPLKFWFCENAGSALPLIALQYHEVKVNVEFRTAAECVNTTVGTTTAFSITSASLYADYIFLDTDERRQFAQVAHEYLIEQLQFTGSEAFGSTAVRQKLNFNHPVKEIVWVAQLDTLTTGTSKNWGDFTSAGANHMVDAKLLLNGQDRFSTRKAGYFNLVQPYQHHTRGPAVGVYVYSFALKPEDHQPSGSVNMSRIDNATMQLTFAGSDAIKLYTYARNYNVFRIVSGMGGLAYAA